MSSKKMYRFLVKGIFLMSFFFFYFFANKAKGQCSVDTVSTTANSCFGMPATTADAQVIFSATGVGPTFNYFIERYSSGFWVSYFDNIASSPSPPYTSFTADSFRVYMIENGGVGPCTSDTLYFSISEPDSLSLNSTPNDATTPSSSDGSIIVNAISGGVPGYTYDWVGPSGYTSTDSTILGLDTGLYVLTVTDDNGCPSSYSYYIDAPACNSGSFTLDSILCNGDQGALNISGVFGVPNYRYYLDSLDGVANWINISVSTLTPDTFYSFSGLYGGTYRYILEDNLGCFDTSFNIILNEPSLLDTLPTITPISTSGACDGAINIVVAGGVSPYTHSWSNGAVSVGNPVVLTGLCTGWYCDTIRDANNCELIWCDSIRPAPPCTPIISIEDNVCPGASSGSALVSYVNLGIEYSQFHYEDDSGNYIGGLNTALAQNLIADSFVLIMEGIVGICPDTMISFVIEEPKIDSLYFIDGQTICSPDSGRVLLQMSNLNTAMQYGYTIGSDTLVAEGDTSQFYAPNDYQYLIYYRDTTSTNPIWLTCDFVDFSILSSDIAIADTTIYDKICGFSLGEVVVHATGAHSPFVYDINPNSTGWLNDSAFSNLDTGVYVLQVQDTLKCLDSVAVTIKEIVQTDLQLDSTLETCRLNDGTIFVLATNGTTPYTYSIDSGMTFSVATYVDSILINNLDSSGNYNVVIKDNNSCMTYYGNVSIGRTPDPVIDSLIPTNESCCGSDGKITVFATAFDLITKYSLDTLLSWQNSNMFQSVVQGEYMVTIEDTNACKDSAEVMVGVDTVPNINMALEHTDIICNGDTNGTIKVLYADSCYDYVLWRYTLQTPQIPMDTSTYFDELIKGYYVVRAESHSGLCIDSSDVVVVQEPDEIIFDPVVSAVFCDNGGICDGQIAINSISGGVPDTIGVNPPYQYYINPIFNNIPLGPNNTTDAFVGLCIGDYQLQVFDANACFVYDTIHLVDSVLKIDSLVMTYTSCFGSTDGSITAYVSGGIGNYSYLWSNAATADFINGLTVGQYTLQLTDAVGCMVLDSTVVKQPDELIFKILEAGKKPESCLSVSYDGEIYLEITGGNPPYFYSWVGNSFAAGNGAGDTIFSLTADTIAITVFDNNFCNGTPAWGTIDTTIVEALNADNPLDIPLVISNPDSICFGTSDGFIDIVAVGGDGPLQYSIDSGITYSYANNFPYVLAGEYDVYVQDIYGCTVSSQIDIFSYSEIQLTVDSIKHISCFEGNDGYLSVIASGGTGEFTYFWVPTSDTTNTINNLTAVPHVIQVIDSASCQQTDTILLYELSEAMQSEVQVISHTDCYGSEEGSVVVQVLGGNPFSSGGYLYVWINENMDTIANENFTDSLGAGTYLVQINDSFACGPITDTVHILQPERLTIDLVNVVGNVCKGDTLGSISVTSSGGTPAYTYYMMDSSLQLTSQASALFNDLSAAVYNLWAVDANNCYSDTLNNVKLGEPGIINIQSNVINSTCFGADDGALELALIGGTNPYVFHLLEGTDTIAVNSVYQSVPVEFNDLYVGRFTLYIEDNNGCKKDSSFIIGQPDEVIADFIVDNLLGTKELSVNLSNLSIGADKFIWDFGDDIIQEAVFSDYIAYAYNQQGEYKIQLVAQNAALSSACNDTAYATVKVEGYDTYNVFTPNNDGINDLFHFNELFEGGINVIIFDRWGQTVYQWEGVNGSWDGNKNNGEKLPKGVYFYHFEVVDHTGLTFEEKGSITLLR